MTEYGEVALSLTEQLIPVSESKSDITINDEFYNKAQAEIIRLTNEMRKINESGKPDQTVMDALSESFDFQMDLAKKYADETAIAWRKFNHYNIAFQKQLLISMKEISSRSMPMMIEIRRDLGLAGDLLELEAQMKQQWARLEISLNKLIINLEKQLAEEKQ